jgi:hypothetical protein
MTMQSQLGSTLKWEPLEASGKGKSISVVIFCFSWRACKAMHKDSGKKSAFEKSHYNYLSNGRV